MNVADHLFYFGIHVGSACAQVEPAPLPVFPKLKPRPHSSAYIAK